MRRSLAALLVVVGLTAAACTGETDSAGVAGGQSGASATQSSGSDGGGTTTAPTRNSVQEMQQALPDLNPDIVQQAVCGLDSVYVRQIMGEAADGRTTEGLADATGLLDEMAVTYEQAAPADARIGEGVTTLRDIAALWRTALSYAEEGKDDLAMEAMAKADPLIESLDALGLNSLC